MTVLRYARIKYLVAVVALMVNHADIWKYKYNQTVTVLLSLAFLCGQFVLISD